MEAHQENTSVIPRIIGLVPSGVPDTVDAECTTAIVDPQWRCGEAGSSEVMEQEMPLRTTAVGGGVGPLTATSDHSEDPKSITLHRLFGYTPGTTGAEDHCSRGSGVAPVSMEQESFCYTAVSQTQQVFLLYFQLYHLK